MTIEEFREHVAGRRLAEGKRPIVDWCGASWEVAGEPAEEWARGRFVAIRPLRSCWCGEGEKLMPVRVAYPLLPSSLTVEDVT
jgi:hypothetical protein